MATFQREALDRSRSSSPVGRKLRDANTSSSSRAGAASSAYPSKHERIRARKDKLLQEAARICVFLYSLFLFCLFGLRALVEGCILKKPGQQFWAELVSARNHLWNLSEDPAYGLSHAFHTLSNGHKLHYITNQLKAGNVNETVKPIVEKRVNLVIFIHGWPDSCMLWRDVINHLPLPLKHSTTLVAVDLPGFGGSDSLPRYSPGYVINAMFEFVLAMRARYLKHDSEEGDKQTGQVSESSAECSPSGGQVLVVAHDWGAICAFQLASRAPQLADRFILCNSILPHLVRENIAERCITASKIFFEWKRDFSRKTLPTKALTPLIPVLRQLCLSSYIFIFNLPLTLANASIQYCNLWAMRLLKSWAVGHDTIMHTPKVVSDIAGFMGPNIITCDTQSDEGEGYGQSVHFRAYEDISAETLRYYREGLGTRIWRRKEHHAHTLHALDLHNHHNRGKKLVGPLEPWPPGRLHAPATILWGERDPALDFRLALEGIDEYLAPNSQVIRLPKLGHWVPLEGEGPAVMAATIEWAVDQDSTEMLLSRVKATSTSAKMTLSK